MSLTNNQIQKIPSMSAGSINNIIQIILSQKYHRRQGFVHPAQLNTLFILQHLTEGCWRNLNDNDIFGIKQLARYHFMELVFVDGFFEIGRLLMPFLEFFFENLTRVSCQSSRFYLVKQSSQFIGTVQLYKITPYLSLV